MLFRQSYRDRTTGESRQSKFWSYEFVFGGSRIRETTGLTSKTAARDAERTRRQKLAEGSSGIRRIKPKLFRQAAEDWIELKRATLAPSSLRIEKKNLDHLLPFFGSILTTDVEAADIARYQEKRRDEDAAAGTINLEVATVRAILRRSGLWARIQPDVRMLPERDDAGRALSAEEEARILTACSESMSRALLPAVTLALHTGLRYGELVELRWKQVDLEARRLTVGKSKTEAGKGRRVPLNASAHAALSAWSKQFPFRQPVHFVFPSERYKMLPDGKGHRAYALDPESPMVDFSEAWEAAKRRTADAQNEIAAVVCRWHDLRHTFCTRLLEASQSLSVVAALMGWSAATTVRMARRYGHLSGEALSAAVALLDGRKTG